MNRGWLRRSPEEQEQARNLSRNMEEAKLVPYEPEPEGQEAASLCLLRSRETQEASRGSKSLQEPSEAHKGHGSLPGGSEGSKDSGRGGVSGFWEASML